LEPPRQLSLDDFDALAEAQGILVIEGALDFPGCFLYHQRRPVILLNRNQSHARRTLTAWHEYGHFLFHTPGHFGLHGKTELEADLIAYCALVPRFLLRWHSLAEIAELYGYDAGIVRERWRIWTRLGV